MTEKPETEKRSERMHMQLHKKNSSPKLLAGKKRGADRCKFYDWQSANTTALQVHAIARVTPGGLGSNPVDKKGGDPGAGSMV